MLCYHETKADAVGVLVRGFFDESEEFEQFFLVFLRDSYAGVFDSDD